ncbi:MAG: pyruvate dehydrogenase complex dihydrolipoamide acetyltransferase [Saprospiraceae bacterium]|nr:pyruvate dehydrogenase complex dihydrolipoamide acetyltransferase [Saprospiraceae bacterium]MDZ4706583.1 pyruvate dehydrogenase complex dihydrolipoamide acetyltransferase [Saprospiraceae bacterium]
MAEIIKMPRMSDTMTEGNIVSWLKKEGDKVESGDTLAEVETDKATMELDSFTDGILLHIAVKEGSVPIDGVIAVIGKAGEDWKTALAAAQDGSNNGSNGQKTAAPEAAVPALEAVVPAPEVPANAASDEDDDKRVKASPLARSIAKDAGIDIAKVAGSGDQGRIIKKDVEAALESQKSAPATAKPETPAAPATVYAAGSGEYEEVPVSQMRRTIARRLSESKFTAPHFYLTVEINMDKAIAMRIQVNEISPVKISFNDFVIKAVAASLRQHPAVNSSWLGDKIRYNKDINIGVAVAVEDGLVVPVVRQADIKTLSQINTEVKAFAAKAKERKIQPQEMQGNTFTISNLGMFGIEEFTAIINPPDACILAIGTIAEKPIVKDGQIVVGNLMRVTLSSDHRVVDGATGAQFLQTFKSILEDPIRLMI